MVFRDVIKRIRIKVKCWYYYNRIHGFLHKSYYEPLCHKCKTVWNNVTQRLKKPLSKYYTYEEVAAIVDEATGMYVELCDNWSITKSDCNDAFSDGAIRPGPQAYYRALIERLPFVPIYPERKTRYKSGTKVIHHVNDITEALFIKKIVNKFMKQEKMLQDAGIQPFLINFYNDKDIYDMHELKVDRARERHCLSEVSENYKVVPDTVYPNTPPDSEEDEREGSE